MVDDEKSARAQLLRENKKTLDLKSEEEAIRRRGPYRGARKYDLIIICITQTSFNYLGARSSRFFYRFSF